MIIQQREHNRKKEKKQNWISQIQNIYQEWLMENYPDEVKTKDDLITLVENGIYFEDFEKEIIQEV